MLSFSTLFIGEVMTLNYVQTEYSEAKAYSIAPANNQIVHELKVKSFLFPRLKYYLLKDILISNSGFLLIVLLPK